MSASLFVARASGGLDAAFARARSEGLLAKRDPQRTPFVLLAQPAFARLVLDRGSPRPFVVGRERGIAFYRDNNSLFYSMLGPDRLRADEARVRSAIVGFDFGDAIDSGVFVEFRDGRVAEMDVRGLDHLRDVTIHTAKVLRQSRGRFSIPELNGEHSVLVGSATMPEPIASQDLVRVRPLLDFQGVLFPFLNVAQALVRRLPHIVLRGDGYQPDGFIPDSESLVAPHPTLSGVLLDYPLCLRACLQRVGTAMATLLEHKFEDGSTPSRREAGKRFVKIYSPGLVEKRGDGSFSEWAKELAAFEVVGSLLGRHLLPKTLRLSKDGNGMIMEDLGHAIAGKLIFEFDGRIALFKSFLDACANRSELHAELARIERVLREKGANLSNFQNTFCLQCDVKSGRGRLVFMDLDHVLSLDIFSKR